MKTTKRSILSFAAMALAAGIVLAPVAPAQAAHAGPFGFFMGGSGHVHHAHSRRFVLSRAAIKRSLRRQGYRHIRLRFVSRGRGWMGPGRRFRRGVYVARVRTWTGHQLRVYVSPYTGRVLRRVHIS